MSKCIDDYYNRVYVPWMNAEPFERYQIEKQFQGVHEFKPEYRGECYTADFDGQHPTAIEKNIEALMARIKREMENQ